MKLASGDVSRGPHTVMLHCVPNARGDADACHDEAKRLLMLRPHAEVAVNVPVKADATLEVCVALSWLGNPEPIDVDAIVEFHSYGTIGAAAARDEVRRSENEVFRSPYIYGARRSSIISFIHWTKKKRLDLLTIAFLRSFLRDVSSSFIASRWGFASARRTTSVGWRWGRRCALSSSTRARSSRRWSARCGPPRPRPALAARSATSCRPRTPP